MKTEALETTTAAVASKTKAPAASPAPPTNQPAIAAPAQVNVFPEPGEPPGHAGVRKLIKNHVGSALVLNELAYPNSGPGPDDFCAVLRASGEEAAAGDTSALQAMLASQAFALDGIFSQFARRAAIATTSELQERMLRIALKAQSQCRTTVESLAVIQQGPAIFAKQANVNNGGQQQVNNGAPPPAASARARGTSKRAKQTIALEKK